MPVVDSRPLGRIETLLRTRRVCSAAISIGRLTVERGARLSDFQIARIGRPASSSPFMNPFDFQQGNKNALAAWLREIPGCEESSEAYVSRIITGWKFQGLPVQAGPSPCVRAMRGLAARDAARWASRHGGGHAQTAAPRRIVPGTPEKCPTTPASGCRRASCRRRSAPRRP